MPKKPPQPDPEPLPPVKPILVRPDDARLLVALDAYRKTIKNSRNGAVLLLLESRLKELGFWPD